MNKFKLFEFYNAVTYKKCIIPLDKQGLVSIVGKNEDTGGSNGAGKSIPWNIIFEKHCFDSRIATNAEVMRTDKNYLSHIQLDKDGELWDSYDYKNHDEYGTKFIVKRNGSTDGLPVDSKPARTFFADEVLGYDLNEHRSCVILNQDFSHVLISGTPSERSEYISNLFNLYYYDWVLQGINDYIRESTEEIATISEKLGKVTSIKEQLKQLPQAKELTDKIALVQKQLIAFRLTQTQLTDKIKEFDIKISRITDLVDVSKDLTDLGWQRETVQDINDAKAMLSDEIKILETKNEKIEDKIKIVTKLNAAKDKVDSFKSVAAEDLVSSAIQEKITDTKTQAKELELRKKELERRIALKKELRITPRPEFTNDILQDKLAYMIKTIADHEAEKTQLQKICTKLSKIPPGDKVSCPYDLACPHEIGQVKTTIDQHKNRIVQITDHVKSYNEEQNLIQTQIDQWQEIAKLEQDLAAIEDGNLDEVTTLYSQLPTIRSLEAKYRTAVAYEQAVQELASLEPVTYDIHDLTSKKAFNLADSKKKQSTIERLTKLEIVVGNANRLDFDSTTTENAEQLVNLYNVQLTELKDKQTIMTTQIENLIREETEAGSKLDQRKQLELKMGSSAELESKLATLRKHKYIYEGCKAFYSKQGYRTVKMQKIVERIRTILPAYTQKLFTEKDIRGFSISDDLSFEIRREYKYISKDKRKDIISKKQYDIRRLSGGERARMGLALIFTQAQIKKKSKQVNFVVLDEIDRHLDEVGQYVLTESLLPSLKNELDTLIVISHRPIKADKFWTVVKKNGISSLIT